MTRKEQDIKRDVRICLDENPSSTALLGNVDTLKLEEIIDSKIEDAALAVINAAPFEKLGDISESLVGEIEIQPKAPYIGKMVMPSGFARLVRFKMKSWKRAVYGAQPTLSPLYEQAYSGYNVRGTKERPLVFLVPVGTAEEFGTGLQLEFFCAGSATDTLDGCLYVKKPTKIPLDLDGSDPASTWEMELGDKLYRPTVYYAAYLTALDVRDTQAAEALMAVVKELLEN